METERLIIDRLKKEDKEDYFYNISHDKKVLETFICVYQDNLDNFDFSKYLDKDGIFAIRLKENKKLIGILTKYKVDGTTIEIGYGLGSSYWNKGYSTEAVKAFIDYLFDKEDFEVILASFFTNNLASKRVMEKVGMTYSHIVYNELEYLGISRDLIYYKIERDNRRQ